MTAPCKQDLWEFIDTHINARPQKSLWFNIDGELNVYFRAGLTYFPTNEGHIAPGVAISSVEVREGKRNTGIFRAFLAEVEKRAKDAGYSSIRVEQVHNHILYDMLIRRGWHVRDEVPPTFFKAL